MSAKSNMNLPTRFLYTPLLVSVAEAELMVKALRGEIQPRQFMRLFDGGQERPYYVTNGVAVLPILGGMTYRGYGWYWNTTYNQIRQDFRAAMVDEQVKAIVFDIDSCGGEVAGCFDLSDEIYNARGEKSIYAVVNENCFSAAYALASAADKIFIPRTGSAGSIGVIAIHFESSKFDSEAGIKWTPIFAGARKNDFSTHEPLSKEAAAVMQARVDRSYDLFCETVARNRNLSVDAVKETQAAIFQGSDAVAAGLADAVATWDDGMSDILSTITSKGVFFMQPNELKSSLAAMIGDPQTMADAHQMIKELGFVPAADQQNIEHALEEARVQALAEGQASATERAVAVIDICHLAGMDEMASQLVKEGISTNDARVRVTESKAAQSNGQQINSTTTPTGTGQQSALVADAKRRAGII